jgi:O-antigen/teichoic acid export membrane protein
VCHPRSSPGASPAGRRGEPVTTIDSSPPACVPDGEPRSQSLTLSPVMMTAGRFGALALGLATAPILARALRPQGRGVTATSLSIITIMSIVMALGIPLAVRRRISAGDCRDRDVIRTARVCAGLTVVPSALLIIPIHTWLLPGIAGLDFTAFCLSMCATPLTVSWSIDANVLVVRHQFRLRTSDTVGGPHDISGGAR